jgi:hypothetical protein
MDWVSLDIYPGFLQKQVSWSLGYIHPSGTDGFVFGQCYVSAAGMRLIGAETCDSVAAFHPIDPGDRPRWLSAGKIKTQARLGEKPPTLQIAVRSNGQNMLRPLHQQRSQIRVTLFADVHLRFALARVPASGILAR